MNGNRTSSRLRHAIILALGLGISNFAFSLRLGPINVKSYLGQPINATIRVDGLNANSASGTKVSLASPAAYRSHGIEMLPIHSQMRFALVPSGKGYIIRVSSTGGVKEPFVNFLVTVSGNGSTVTREYAAFFNPNPSNASAGKTNKPTVVVEKSKPQKNNKVIAERSAEPPKTRTHAANTSGWGGKPVAKKPAPKPAPKPVAEPVRPAPAPAPAPTAQASSSGSPHTPSSIPVGSTYGPIKPGETLYSIAKAARPNENMRIYDMMRLIYKANRRAFSGNNMGNLMAGATLHIPDPGSRGSSATKPAPEPKAKPAPKPEPKAKPTPKPEKKPQPPVEAEKPTASKPEVSKPDSIKPEKTPTSPAAQLAFGVEEEKKTEIPTPPPVAEEPVKEVTPPIDMEKMPESEGLRLDSPETIETEEPKVEVPPPIIELPKPEPVEEVKPEPQPEPKPAPKPAPRPAPQPQPAPQAVEDDSFFGLGKFVNDLGIPLPFLGGGLAGLLALLGGLFWFLKKRKKPAAGDQMDEFSEDEIQKMVAEMEEEHGELDFDQISSQQLSDIETEQPAITKLDPISEPYPDDVGSVDELSDDFFKDLEVSVEEDSASDTGFMTDETITDSSEIGDNFFDDLEFDGGSDESTSDHFDDFLTDSPAEVENDDFLSDLDNEAFSEIDSNFADPEPKAAASDDFDDFFSSPSPAAEDDFFADESSDTFADLSETPAVEENPADNHSLDFLDELDSSDDLTNSHEELSLEPEPAASEEDHSLDFFSTDDIEEKADDVVDSATEAFSADDDNSLDFFSNTADEKEDAGFNASDDFFADESTTSEIELEKKEQPADDNSLDFFTDPVSEAIPPAADVPPKPAAPSLAKPSAPQLAPQSAAPKVDEDAMEINLDMAKSFISMGKSEKARSWLEEVLELGTEDQKAQAHKMLSGIDKG